MTVLGVILARAGSEGLPNKHLRPLNGRPVISYTFDHVRASFRLSRVVVSSDCQQIRKLAQREGFATIARPAVLATSDASVQSVMLHAMKEVERTSNFHADALVVLYGNVPIRPRGAIDRAIDILQSTGCDSVRSFCAVGKWHPAWMARLDGANRVVALQEGSIHRRQELEPMFLHDGGVVAVSRASMLQSVEHPDDPHAFFGTDRRGFKVDASETVEIDQMRDLYWAEAVLRDRQQATHELRIAS
jgi:CMP-N-acetylneuraminic acid synthetase